MVRLSSLDPREYAIQVNDIVERTPGGPEWRVTKVRGSTLYLRSVLGGRFGHTTSNDVIHIKRDWTYEQEPDWTHLYGEETADL